jgi:hypothetical protein
MASKIYLTVKVQGLKNLETLVMVKLRMLDFQLLSGHAVWKLKRFDIY